jgi:hypothetical protein
LRWICLKLQVFQSNFEHLLYFQEFLCSKLLELYLGLDLSLLLIQCSLKFFLFILRRYIFWDLVSNFLFSDLRMFLEGLEYDLVFSCSW